jgi:hypothetical protein
MAFVVAAAFAVCLKLKLPIHRESMIVRPKQQWHALLSLQEKDQQFVPAYPHSLK